MQLEHKLRILGSAWVILGVMLGDILRLYWGYVWVILGLYGGYMGLYLGLYWGYIYIYIYIYRGLYWGFEGIGLSLSIGFLKKSW